uniref:Peptidase S1 domain-containing protein n=1 Tax=Terrapene triunguis TaxID=2587831 RepID=A0A674I8T0_9SAUR
MWTEGEGESTRHLSVPFQGLSGLIWGDFGLQNCYLQPIIRGWKAQPHFRPYMAYLEIQSRDKRSCCGGFLVAENFVLTLEHKAELNEQVRFIRLPAAHWRVQPGTVCSVIGWGRTSAPSKGLSRTLREVDLKVLDDEACLNYPGGIYRKYKTITIMCMGDPKEHKASFKGDSGGPLVCGKTAQGIVSWGPVNGSPPRIWATMRRLQP